MARTPYDEFGLFHENAAEAGLPWEGPPRVRRTEVALADGRSISALVWGEEPPQIAFLHGGAQNAHTWDTVALALGRPLVALDLPGHGRSSWREDARYDPEELAEDVAPALRELAPEAAALVGMSLGGLTAIVLAARHPELVRKLVVVDVTPGTTIEKSKPIADFVRGPQRFDDFEEILRHTIAHNPTRTVSSLRRGILHNARQLDDGSWEWRYHRGLLTLGERMPNFVALWDDVGRIQAPTLLARGTLSPVVDDEDEAEFRRRLPTAEVLHVEGAGHSIQGDKPVALAHAIERFVCG